MLTDTSQFRYPVHALFLIDKPSDYQCLVDKEELFGPSRSTVVRYKRHGMIQEAYEASQNLCWRACKLLGCSLSYQVLTHGANKHFRRVHGEPRWDVWGVQAHDLSFAPHERGSTLYPTWSVSQPVRHPNAWWPVELHTRHCVLVIPNPTWDDFATAKHFFGDDLHPSLVLPVTINKTAIRINLDEFTHNYHYATALNALFGPAQT